MKLTTKGKYAVIALMDMAIYNNNAPTSLNIISERQKISISYLEQLFVKLRRNDIVKSHKGPGGGYILAKGLQDIKVSHIIQAVDDNLDARTCYGGTTCHNNRKCLTHDLWEGLTQHVYKYLDGITLNDLFLQQNNKIIKYTKNIVTK